MQKPGARALPDNMLAMLVPQHKTYSPRFTLRQRSFSVCNLC
jgi:hypothetical protein